jgi:hypothetical protein
VLEAGRCKKSKTKKSNVMKTVINILIGVFMVVAIPTLAAPKPSDCIRVVSTKRYLFHFKADKALLGACIEIRDDQQRVVQTEQIRQVKMIIDFFTLRPGNYTIVIEKDGRELSFPYANPD